jgi:hypothetical protein
VKSSDRIDSNIIMGQLLPKPSHLGFEDQGRKQEADGRPEARMMVYEAVTGQAASWQLTSGSERPPVLFIWFPNLDDS